MFKIIVRTLCSFLLVRKSSICLTDSSDFFGINMYTSSLVFPTEYNLKDVGYYPDMGVKTEKDPSWPR